MPNWLDRGQEKAEDIKKTSADKTEKPTGEGSNALLIAQQGAEWGELDDKGAKVDVTSIKARFAAGQPRADHVVALAEKTSRARMVEVVAQLEEADIRAMGESSTGLALVDAVVHTNQNVAFTKLAIHAIWDVEFDKSDWGGRDIHHIYFMFREVPKLHVKGIVRQLREGASKTDGSSWFKANGQTAEGGQRGDIEMAQPLPSNLSMGAAENLLRHRTLRAAALFGATLPVGGLGVFGVLAPGVRQNVKFLKARSPYSQAMRPKNAYQMTALHEMGHGVDGRLGVMDKYKAHPKFGGWKEYLDEGSLVEDVVTAASYAPFAASAGAVQEKARIAHDEAHIKQLEADFEAMPEDAPKAVIRQKHAEKTDAIGKAKITKRTLELGDKLEKEQESFHGDEEHGGLTRPLARKLIKHLVAGGSGKEFAKANRLNAKQIEAHPITKAIYGGRGDGKWMRDEGTMTKQSLDGRSFAQAYGQNHWVSFRIDAKREGVSHYQWRAPGEWFAELYAHFYMGTLAGHPLYNWFKSEIHENDPKNRPPDQQDVATPEQVEARQAAEGQEAEGEGEGDGGAAPGGERAQSAPPQPGSLPAPAQASRGGSAS